MGESSWNGYEHNALLLNVGGGRFLDVARPTGCDGLRDGRGVGVADFDGDGRLDWVVANNDARPTFYLNRLPAAGRHLRLELAGTRSGRDAVGARARLTAAGRTQTRWVKAGSGYASQSDFPLHFGLGGAELPEELEVTWPAGGTLRLDAGEIEELLAGGRTLRLEEPPA